MTAEPDGVKNIVALYLPYATSYSLSYNLPDLPPLQNAEPVSGIVLGLPVRNLAVGAVVGL